MIHFSCYMIPTWKIESNIRKCSRKQGRSKLLLLNKWTEKTTIKTELKKGYDVISDNNTILIKGLPNLYLIFLYPKQ